MVATQARLELDAGPSCPKEALALLRFGKGHSLRLQDEGHKWHWSPHR